MDLSKLKKLLKKIQAGELEIVEALKVLRKLPYEDLGYAKIDHHRHLRRGFPEVIFCEGKTPEQIINIMTKLYEAGHDVLATRANEELYQAVKTKVIPEVIYYPQARLITIKKKRGQKRGEILVITGGTADIPVAEEAAITAKFFGHKIERLYDVGVAGLHRLIDNIKFLSRAKVIIVVAGMEGALASVVAGMVDKPVVAVPTSIGYGVSFKGLAALLTMLNSCAPGIAVVNIDNGFGAAYLASLISQAGIKR